MIAAASENPGGTEAHAVRVLAAACAERGLDVKTTDVAPGRPNLVARLPGGDSAGLAFLGHSDVVPAGPGWTRDPFGPEISGGRLYGRGSTDMKGGLASIVVAMGAIKNAGIELPGPIDLICTVDEEDADLGVRAYVEGVLAAPDGPPSYAACIVAEPTDLETVIACRGACNLVIDIGGVAAHAGRPQDGANAIDAAAKVIGLIRDDHERMTAAASGLLGSGTWNVGRIDGGHGTSIVADSCTIHVDRRLMPGESADGVRDRLADAIRQAGIDTGGITVTVDVEMEMPGFSTPPDHHLVTSAVAALADGAGITSEIGGWTAACDGGFIARDLGVPTIVLGPGGLNDQAHQPDESVAVDELVSAARAYTLLGCGTYFP
nr:M20 family metallopeptidase [Spelaeicoccus albus]